MEDRQSAHHETCQPLSEAAGNLPVTFAILLFYLGLILDSTGFAKPKVHAEGRFAS